MLCRLCVNECNNFIDIHKTESAPKISTLISLYFTFHVPPDDEKSTKVCRSCCKTICAFDSFRQTVENAQQKWQAIKELEQENDEQEIGFEECSYLNTYEDERHCESNIQTMFTESHTTEDSNYNEEKLSKDPFSDVEENKQFSDENEATKVEFQKIQSHSHDKQENKVDRKKLSQIFNELIGEHSNLFCNECKKPMPCFKDLKKHFRLSHQKPGYMICCKRKFFNAAGLADHINFHLNPEYFKCDQCEKSLSSRYSLDFHKKTCHDEQNSSYKCKHCSRKFLTSSVRDTHEKAHEHEFENEKLQGVHYCTECEKSYPNEKKLKIHIFNVHRIAYIRICHLCGKSVRGEKALQRHQSEHAGNKPMVKCHVCSAELSTKGILKAHVQALHPDDSSLTFICNICGKSSPSQRALKKHIDYVHKCERIHICNICDKSFKKMQALKEHYAIHTGDRLYECPHCDKTFKVRANMHHHRKLKHPKEFEENRRRQKISKK